MGSSSQTNETIFSWSLDRRPVLAPYQYSGNNGHSFCTEESYTIHTPLLCYDFHRLICQQIRRNTLPQPMYGGMGNSPLMPEHHIVLRICHIPGKFNILADHLLRLDRPLNTECSLDQPVGNCIFQRLNYPNVDLFVTRFSHKLSLYVSPFPDNQALVIDALSMNWNYLHAYAFPSTILIPSILAKIRQSLCRIVVIALLCPQCPWFSKTLQLLVSAPI